MFSKIVMIGRLTRDMELRFTADGTAVGSGCLAITDTWKDKSGQKKENVAFVEFTAFGARAESACNYTRKGSKIMVEGKFNQQEWQDKKTGETKRMLKVTASQILFLDDKKSSDAGSPVRPQGKGMTPGEAARAAGQTDQSCFPTGSNDADDVPF